MKGDVSIVTPRLRIVSFGERHITNQYLGWLNNPILMRYSNQRFLSHTHESCMRYLASYEGTDNLFLAIEFMAEPELIGTMTVYFDARHSRADMGILIGHPAARGRGCGVEAWVAVMRYVFDVRFVRKITAGAMVENVAMCRLAERAGMRRDGVRERHNLLDGRPVDVVHFAAFRDEWNSKVLT